jgi:hypothetical protein
MLVHIDSAQVRAAGFNNSNNRPRSIEVNMKRDMNHPMSIWAAQNLGPSLIAYVQDSSIAIPLWAPTGGIPWIANPSNKRTIASSLTNPELPLGQWNTGEYLLRGADSGVFTLNGQTRMRIYDFRASTTSTGHAAAAKQSCEHVMSSRPRGTTDSSVAAPNYALAGTANVLSYPRRRPTWPRPPTTSSPTAR